MSQWRVKSDLSSPLGLISEQRKQQFHTGSSMQHHPTSHAMPLCLCKMSYLMQMTLLIFRIRKIGLKKKLIFILRINLSKVITSTPSKTFQIKEVSFNSKKPDCSCFSPLRDVPFSYCNNLCNIWETSIAMATAFVIQYGNGSFEHMNVVLLFLRTFFSFSFF